MRYYNLTLWGSQDFWGNVARSPTFLIKQVLFSYPASQSKVSNHIVFSLILIDPDHDILKLQIPMDYSFLPKMLKPFRDIPDRFKFLPISSKNILNDSSCTFLSSSSKVPPSRYSMTQISSFLDMYRLSMAII